jgi:hypothetical protein
LFFVSIRFFFYLGLALLPDSLYVYNHHLDQLTTLAAFSPVVRTAPRALTRTPHKLSQFRTSPRDRRSVRRSELGDGIAARSPTFISLVLARRLFDSSRGIPGTREQIIMRKTTLDCHPLHVHSAMSRPFPRLTRVFTPCTLLSPANSLSTPALATYLTHPRASLICSLYVPSTIQARSPPLARPCTSRIFVSKLTDWLIISSYPTSLA